jgi:hypothetical protein
MILQELAIWLSPFIWGFAIGFFCYPSWKISKKIWQEAKKTRKEWSQPNG